MFRFHLIASLLLTGAAGANAQVTEIDFSSLAEGDSVTTQFPGVTFSLIGSPSGAGPFVVNPGSTQDAGSGGNLITPMDQLTDPCCVGPFYDIQIDFASAIDFFSILALDAEVGETYTLTAFLDGMVVVAPFSSIIIGNFWIPTSSGPIRENILGSIGGGILFNRVLIDLSNSEGPEVWDDVSFTTVAVPGTVTIDIKPGSDPNNINPQSNGIIRVAILGSIDFDATQVAFSTVTFGPDGAAESLGRGYVEDVNGDSYPDMVLQFRIRETGIACGDTEASLSGEIFSGEEFVGTDAIRTVGCK